MSNRRELGVLEKCNLLKAYDKLPKMSIRKAAMHLNISHSTLSGILRNRAIVVQAALGNEYRIRKRSGKEEAVDIALKEWFLKERDKDSRITGPILRKKAEELAKGLGKDNFIATDGWVQRWKKRENIVFGKGFEEQLDVNPAPAEGWYSSEWPALIAQYSSFDSQFQNRNGNWGAPLSHLTLTTEHPNELTAVQPSSREELNNSSINETFRMRAPVSTQSSIGCPQIPSKWKNPLQNISYNQKPKKPIQIVDDEMKNFVKSYGTAISKGLEALPADVAIEFSLKVLKEINEKILEAKFEQNKNESVYSWCSDSNKNEKSDDLGTEIDANIEGEMPTEKPNEVTAVLESSREEPNITSFTDEIEDPVPTQSFSDKDTNEHKKISSKLKKPQENQSSTVQDNNIPFVDVEMKNYVKSYGLAISRGLETLPGDVTIGVALNILKELNEKVLKTEFKHSWRSMSDYCGTGMDVGDQEVLPKDKEDLHLFLDTPIKIEPAFL